MSKVVVDPDELKRFANDLKRFNRELLRLTGGLQSKLSGLAQTWRDQEHEKFVEEFQQTFRVMTKFAEASHEHAQALARKAAKAEEYLKG